MKEVNDLINTQFGNRLRVRISAMIVSKHKILLLKQLTNTEKGFVWLPPGGGMKFGESIVDGLMREVLEETGLIIKSHTFYGVTEYLKFPLHSIELFYTCTITQGNAIMGHDPELNNDEQLIRELQWFALEELLQVPEDEKHEILKDINSISHLLSQ